MTILKELFSVLNEKKVEDDQYFVTVGTGKKFDLFTERGFPSFEAARKFVRSSLSAIQNDRDSDTDDADDEAEQLENAEIMSGAQLKKSYPKLFEAATFELMAKNGQVKRFKAGSREEAIKTAKAAKAKSLIKCTPTGMPIGKPISLTEARSIPSWFQDGAKVKLMPEYADKDPNEVFTLKSVDTETGKARISDDQGKGWNISYYQVYPKNKTPAIHESAEKLTADKAEKEGHTWLVKFTHCPTKTDTRDYTIRSVKAISSSQAVAAAKAKLPADVRDCAKVDQLKMTDKNVEEGYGSFDGGKRAFKRAELEHELGHETRETGNRTFSYSKPRAELGSFGIEINGRLFKREGEPVKFSSKGTAEKAASTIASKEFNKGKKVEVVPLKEDEALQGLGKSLSGKSMPSSKEAEEPMDDTSEVTEPTDKKTGPSDSEVTGDADEQESSAEFKVGDVVKTLVGPHKGQEHDVVKVHADGRMDLKPKGLEGPAIKYRNGGVTAKPEQVVLAESIIHGTKSLLRTITIDLTEARGDGMMPLSYKPGKGHKIEAHGRKGMKNTMWRKCFKDEDALSKWCDDNDATVEGSRKLDKEELR